MNKLIFSMLVAITFISKTAQIEEKNYVTIENRTPFVVQVLSKNKDIAGSLNPEESKQFDLDNITVEYSHNESLNIYFKVIPNAAQEINLPQEGKTIRYNYKGFGSRGTHIPTNLTINNKAVPAHQEFRITEAI